MFHLRSQRRDHDRFTGNHRRPRRASDRRSLAEAVNGSPHRRPLGHDRGSNRIRSGGVGRGCRSRSGCRPARVQRPEGLGELGARSARSGHREARGRSRPPCRRDRARHHDAERNADPDRTSARGDVPLRDAALLRRPRSQADRRGRATGHLRQEHNGAPSPDRRRRGHRPVERSAVTHDDEARPCPRSRQHDRAQAVTGNRSRRVPARRRDRRRRRAGGGRQHPSRRS